MEEKKRIITLFTLLKKAEVEAEDALSISLRVRFPEKREQMIAWLENNPQATVYEILEKSREIADSIA